MLYEVKKKQYHIVLSVSESGALFHGGNLGEFKIDLSPIFRLHLENENLEAFEVTSETGWKTVRTIVSDSLIKLWFRGAESFGDITVVVTGKVDEKGVSWYVDVINDSLQYSVTDVTYPLPALSAVPLHVFCPNGCGYEVRNTELKKHSFHHDYPHHYTSMQYLACWSERYGVYFGIHDPKGSLKSFNMDAENGEVIMSIVFPAIGAGNMANTFSVGGYIRWEIFEGDWYDATLLYAHFVKSEAMWLPVKGRPDTAERFKSVPYWVCDYIPNSESQRDARPMTLAAVSDRYDKNYWLDAPIQLRKRLGVPVAYHVYNWHEIPFNINYPHFLPARQVFIDGLKKLQEEDIYVLPYINAVSWEKNDTDEGHTENFQNTGCHGAAMKADGSPYEVNYPQKKENGDKTRLVPMCPTFRRWHEIVDGNVRGLEALGVDGIYFDEITAHRPRPCRNPEHPHLPGGGSYWMENYMQILEKINAEKPDDSFYFSESSGEAYMKAFDGYLTWLWTMGNDVPAFPTVYAGYIQMVGRYTDGKTRDDDMLFRYHLAEGLLFGQQLGWINAHVVYNEARMCFLEKIVHARYENTKIFNQGHVLRPPTIESSLAPVTSSDVTMRQVVGGVWQADDMSRTVLFAVNISESPATAKMILHPEEYGVSCAEQLEISLEPLSVSVIELG